MALTTLTSTLSAAALTGPDIKTEDAKPITIQADVLVQAKQFFGRWKRETNENRTIPGGIVPQDRN